MGLGGLGFVPHRQTLKLTPDDKLYHPVSDSTVKTSASKYAGLGSGFGVCSLCSVCWKLRHLAHKLEAPKPCKPVQIPCLSGGLRSGAA